MAENRTFTPVHLALLRWFKDQAKTGGLEYVSFKRVERDFRFKGQKIAIHESMLELTGRSANVEPFLLLHPGSNKHVRITTRGLEACTKYDVETKHIGGQDRELVVLAATRQVPKATPVDDGLDDLPPDDDDDDDLPAPVAQPMELEDGLDDRAPADGADTETETFGREDDSIGQELPAPPPKTNPRWEPVPINQLKPEPEPKTKPAQAKPKGGKKPASLPPPVRPIGRSASMPTAVIPKAELPLNSKTTPMSTKTLPKRTSLPKK